MLTLSQLHRKAQEQILNSKSAEWFNFGDTGWKSTCPSNPMAGGIFMEADETDLILVEFVDKRRVLRQGYLVGFSYEKYINATTITVLIADETGIITSGCYNCGMKLSKKIITSKKINLPAFTS